MFHILTYRSHTISAIIYKTRDLNAALLQERVLESFDKHWVISFTAKNIAAIGEMRNSSTGNYTVPGVNMR